MLEITLPDGSKREFEGPVTVAQIAASIGAGLARAALAGRVDGKLVDLSETVDHDASVAIISGKDEACLLYTSCPQRRAHVREARSDDLGLLGRPRHDRDPG